MDEHLESVNNLVEIEKDQYFHSRVSIIAHVEVEVTSKPEPLVVFVGSDGIHIEDLRLYLDRPIDLARDLSEAFENLFESNSGLCEVYEFKKEPHTPKEPFIEKPERTYQRDHEKTRFKFKKSGKVRRKR